ncbi:MAG: TolC family protein, partial [Gemmatimonadetes bacterium]|nr:TolC family protein [Gemmatimonadota bacterium]
MRIRRSPLAWLIVSVALLTTVLADDDVSALLVPPVLDLQTAQRIALRKNPSLQAADARVREARARVRNATAQFFPTLGISGSGTRTRTSENTAREIETTASPFDQAAIDELGAIVRNAAQELELVDRRARRDADMKRRNALRDRPLLLEAEVRRQAANERERQAYRDALERELSDLSVSQNVLDVLQRQTAVDVDETRTSYGTGLYATWQIFDGFSRKFNRVAARHGETESRFSRRDAQRLLLGAVALAYYEVHLASERIAIAKADLDFNTRLLGDARARHKAGRASLSIVLNFEVRQNAALSAMFEARRRLRSGWIGLAALMGGSVAELPG